MFPGMQDLIPKGKEREGTLRVKKFLSIMNSMTDEELDNPKVQFNQSRMIRKFVKWFHSIALTDVLMCRY